MATNHAQYERFDDEWDDRPSALNPPRSSGHAQTSSTSPQSHSESLIARVDRLAKAAADTNSVVREHGVVVEVKATGHVVAIRFDDQLFPGGGRLGAMLTEMLNRARSQAQAQVGDLAREVQSDPRVTRMVEQIHDSPELDTPRHAKPCQRQWNTTLTASITGADHRSPTPAGSGTDNLLDRSRGPGFRRITGYSRPEIGCA